MDKTKDTICLNDISFLKQYLAFLWMFGLKLSIATMELSITPENLLTLNEPINGYTILKGIYEDVGAMKNADPISKKLFATRYEMLVMHCFGCKAMCLRRGFDLKLNNMPLLALSAKAKHYFFHNERHRSAF
jgi:hypothetical protein